jgi:hypothetical protein
MGRWCCGKFMNRNFFALFEKSRPLFKWRKGLIVLDLKEQRGRNHRRATKSHPPRKTTSASSGSTQSVKIVIKRCTMGIQPTPTAKRKSSFPQCSSIIFSYTLSTRSNTRSQFCGSLRHGLVKCDKRIGFRRTGWSPLGVAPRQVSQFHRDERYQFCLPMPKMVFG